MTHNLFVAKSARLALSGAHDDKFVIDDIEKDFDVCFLQPISLYYGKPGIEFIEFRNYLSTSNRLSALYIETYTLSGPTDNKPAQSVKCINRILKQYDPSKVTGITFAHAYHTTEFSPTTDGQTPMRYCMHIGYYPIMQVVRRGIRFADPGQPSVDVYRDFMVEIAFMTKIRSIFMVPFFATKFASLLQTTLIETLNLTNTPEEETRENLEAEIEERLKKEGADAVLPRMSLFKILSPLPNSLNAFCIDVWASCKMDESGTARSAVERICAKIESTHSGLLFADPLEVNK